MNNNPSLHDVQQQHREKLIDEHPFFSTLNSEQKKQLAALANQYHCSTNQTLFHQYDEIDVVYLIVEGDIEMIEEEKNNHTLLPQCILSAGDAIGISDTDFLSNTGTCSTTLTCLSDVTLIGWPIEIFIDFIQTHSKAWASVHKHFHHLSELMMRINFIKKVAFFSHIPPKKISKLAKKMTSIDVKAGEIVFREGEVGNECYLIESGQIEILINDRQNNFNQISVLTHQDIFGEIALLTDIPRTATARALQDSRLLIIQRNEFHDLIESNHTTAELITTQALERARPIRNPEVEHYHRPNADGEVITILKHTQLKRYYQLSPVGWFIWQQLDGSQTIENIVMNVFHKFNLFSIDTVTQIILNLIDQGFVKIPAMPLFNSLACTPTEMSFWETIKNKFYSYIVIHRLFKDIDHYITTSYHRFIYLFFTKTSAIIFSSIMMIGFIFFIFSAQKNIFLIPTIQFPFLFFVSLFALHYVLVLFHELGHAYTVKFFNHEVHQAGILFYWLGLFAYVDTSDMWLSDDPSRVRVNLAGIVVDLILAGLFCIGMQLISPGQISLFFWLSALLLYLSVLINLNPLNEGDGYQALIHTLNAPKLRCDAAVLLKKITPIFTDKNFIKQHFSSLLFWILNVSFLITNLILAMIAAHYINLLFSPTLFYLPTQYLSWMLPGLVLIHFGRKVQLIMKHAICK